MTDNCYTTDKESHHREKASIIFAWKTNRALRRNVANMQLSTCRYAYLSHLLFKGCNLRALKRTIRHTIKVLHASIVCYRFD